MNFNKQVYTIQEKKGRNLTRAFLLLAYLQMRIALPLLKMWNLQTILAILGTLCLTSISAYKNGKVEKSCESMMPEHHSQPNTTGSPYTLTVDARKFSPGDNIRGKTYELTNHYYFFLPV